jgi:formylglycine-generating enzyme required for sulfatase activity
VIYVVQAGDTLSEIAKEFGVTVEALQEANAISDPTSLQIDQELVIPQRQVAATATSTSVSPPSAQVVHVVQEGDTLSEIAKQYGVTVEALQEVNAISDPKRLQIGQELVIPQGGTITPTMDITPSVQATPTVAGAPEGMVFVRAGEFIMGSPEGEGLDNEHPQRTVYLDAFYISKYEVTNEQFSQFVEATGYTTDAETAGWGWAWTGEDLEEVEGADWRHPQGPGSSIEGEMDHPVVQVSWNDADAYCQWAGVRLPTEAEWEKAARGTDAREYPWGNSAPDGSKLNYCDVNCELVSKDSSVDDGYADTAPVGHYEAGKSPYGAYDMAGNVWEWVADWYDADYYSKAPDRNPQGADSGERRVVRGGSWSGYQGDARCTDRYGGDPDVRISYFGFRVAASSGSP